MIQYNGKTAKTVEEALDIFGDEYILADLDTKKNTSIMKYRQKY